MCFGAEYETFERVKRLEYLLVGVCANPIENLKLANESRGGRRVGQSDVKFKGEQEYELLRDIGCG